MSETVAQAQAEIDRIKPIERSDHARVEAARHQLAQAESIHALSMSMLNQAHTTLKLIKRRDELLGSKP